jgi:hypothetical protein
MISAIDSSVILDVLTADRTFADASERALRDASREGSLILNECVLAEIFPAFREKNELEEFLADWQLEFVASTVKSAVLAGECFARYLRRRRGQRRILADFLIAAHAQVHADRLIARDRGYLRDYFSALKLIDPSP